MDYVHGKYLYELEFETPTHEYEYGIDAKDGALFKKDVDGKTVLKPEKDTEFEGESAEYISPQTAQDAALAHAQADRAGAIFEKTKWKVKKASAVYEIEYNGVEYKFWIDSSDGEVRLVDRD